MDSLNRGLAAMQPAAGRDCPGTEMEQGPEERTATRKSPGNRVRELQVTGTAEARCPADRASVRVSLDSTKESVPEVTNSVLRRIEYILQSLRQHGLSDTDASVRKLLHRGEDLYCLDAEVAITFSDFDKMEQLHSVLLEKLDKSISVGPPHFYHSPESLGQLRKQVCVSAVENAQQKAREISELLGQSLGPPVLVREEETREWRNKEEEEEEEYGGRGHSTIPIVTASSRVSVYFSLKDRSGKKS